MTEPEHGVTEEPRWTRADYATFYSERCEPLEIDGKLWHVGKGIGPAAHPLQKKIPFDDFECKKCGGLYPYFEVVAATLDLPEGSAEVKAEEADPNKAQRYSFEFRCDMCRSFNQIATK